MLYICSFTRTSAGRRKFHSPTTHILVLMVFALLRSKYDVKNTLSEQKNCNESCFACFGHREVVSELVFEFPTFCCLNSLKNKKFNLL